MRISDWSSDVCSSDLEDIALRRQADPVGVRKPRNHNIQQVEAADHHDVGRVLEESDGGVHDGRHHRTQSLRKDHVARSEEHTSELQSLMRISYAAFCLKKKTPITEKSAREHAQVKNHTRHTIA